MVVIAPYCQYKKTNFKIYIVMLLIAAAYFAYDGYFNKTFIKKHTNLGKPDSTLVFNQKSPPFLLAGAIVIAVWYWKVKDRKLIADDEAIAFSEKDKIPYNSIESINKTSYDSKGFFIIEYKSDNGQKSQRKISNRTYDNLDAVLDLLVSKITS
jgi:hypothetical protein